MDSEELFIRFLENMEELGEINVEMDQCCLICQYLQPNLYCDHKQEYIDPETLYDYVLCWNFEQIKFKEFVLRQSLFPRR